jgi:hypothetical protein
MWESRRSPALLADFCADNILCVENVDILYSEVLVSGSSTSSTRYKTARVSDVRCGGHNVGIESMTSMLFQTLGVRTRFNKLVKVLPPNLRL